MKDRELLELAEERVRDMHQLQREGLVPLDGDYFPSVHYPPITMYDATDEAEFLQGYRNPCTSRSGYSRHIPGWRRVASNSKKEALR